MGGTVLAQGDTCVGGCNLHIGLSVGDLLAHLVVHTAGDEFGKRADERNLARDGQSGGGAHHIGFGDAALDEAIREFGRKGVHLERTLKVCGEGHYAAVGLSGLQETHAKAAAGVLFTCICILFHD